MESETMDNYTEPQKIDIISQGMQRIEDTLRDAVECIEDAGELIDASSLKEALTICELMNPNNHTKG
tara:strand:+ start:225 stop:425 length:201 start_codon:yes stop_codon:yes gene_type:complete